jgi:cytochrome c oxidase subunit 2
MLLGLIFCLVILAGLSLFLFKPVWFPLAISAEALTYDHQFSRTLWICGAIFVAAHLVLAWTVLRGRNRAKPSGAAGPRQLETIWTAAAVALFLAMAVLGSRSWAKTPTGTAGKEVIHVWAHQFAWNFHYAGPDGVFGRTDIQRINDASGNPLGLDPADAAAKDDIVASTLRVPAERDVLLLLHSRDVIHDFFVRELRTKQDIVPGMEIPLELHVDKPGTYEIACAELCGLGHSQMRSVMIVMPPDEYARWKASH